MPGKEPDHNRLSDKLLTVQTILLTGLLFVAAPLQANGIVSLPLWGLLFGLVLVPALFMVSGSRLAVVSIAIAIALVIVAAGMNWRQPSTVDKVLDAFAWLIAGLTLGVVAARAVFAPGRVTFHRVIGGTLLYLNIGSIFVALIGFLALIDPNVLTNLQPLEGNYPTYIYFSFTTLTTTGYGDIVPVHPYARSLANIEQIIGQLYPAILIARLVTLEIESRQKS